MTERKLDAVAVGTCYVDTNVDSFAFTRDNLGEELIAGRYEVVPGGSAVNFCRLGSELGLRTAFIGMAGSDANGDTLEQLLRRQGVEPSLVRRPDLLTNIGFNITNPQGEHIMFIAGTANRALDPEDVLPRLREVLPQSRMLYLGGCLKLKALAPAFGEIAGLAVRQSGQLAVDHGRVPEGVSAEMVEAVKALVLKSAYYFPSREEFCALWEVPGVEEGLHKLRKLAPALAVVVKDGPNGALYLEGPAIRRVAAEKVEDVVNATGAGDSFNAGVIAALLKGLPVAEAVAYGCRVAAAKIASLPLPRLT